MTPTERRCADEAFWAHVDEELADNEQAMAALRPTEELEVDAA